MRILIAGGGIGGLVLALMLHRQGTDCVILEAAETVRPLGVGINALPHAVAELDALGLLPQLDDIAIRTRRLTYANHLGQEIWSQPRGCFGGHAAPQFSIHRGRLQSLLWRTAVARLGAASVLAGHRLAGCRQTDTGIVATVALPDGAAATIAGDALVGADGIHSWTRGSLHPAQPGLRWNGITMWRGATDWPAFAGGDAMVIAGDAVVKLVLYPIAPGAAAGTRLTNWVIYATVTGADTPTPQRQSWSRRGDYAEFAPLVERLRLPLIDVERLIRSTTDIFEYPMCDRDPLPWWTQGRLTLLGDAAHPMYPVGSNGASQAILDARCLATQLRTLPVPDALRGYEAQRLPATSELVRSNRRGGPERVIDLVAARAPGGFDRVSDVASAEELAEITTGYARLAGFALAQGSGVAQETIRGERAPITEAGVTAPIPAPESTKGRPDDAG